MYYECELEKEIEELEEALDELTKNKKYRTLDKILPPDQDKKEEP